MANTAQKVSAYPACTAPKAVDTLMILSANTSNGAVQPFDTKHSTVAQLLSNAVFMSSNTIQIKSSFTPPTSNATPYVVGQMWSDDNYLYVVRSTGIKRVALTSF